MYNTYSESTTPIPTPSFQTPTPMSLTPTPLGTAVTPTPVQDSEDMWFTIDTGSGTSRCFTKKDVKNFGFKSWKEQVPNCNISGNCSLSCQSCTQESGCSGQYCPSLKSPRELYKLGPKVSIEARGSLASQPYTFPLPLDYGGKNPKIPLNLMPWEGVP